MKRQNMQQVLDERLQQMQATIDNMSITMAGMHDKHRTMSQQTAEAIRLLVGAISDNQTNTRMIMEQARSARRFAQFTYACYVTLAITALLFIIF